MTNWFTTYQCYLYERYVSCSMLSAISGVDPTIHELSYYEHYPAGPGSYEPSQVQQSQQPSQQQHGGPQPSATQHFHPPPSRRQHSALRAKALEGEGPFSNHCRSFDSQIKVHIVCRESARQSMQLLCNCDLVYQYFRRMHGAVSPPLQCVFIVCCKIKHRNKVPLLGRVIIQDWNRT